MNVADFIFQLSIDLRYAMPNTYFLSERCSFFAMSIFHVISVLHALILILRSFAMQIIRL